MFDWYANVAEMDVLLHCIWHVLACGLVMGLVLRMFGSTVSKV